MNNDFTKAYSSLAGTIIGAGIFGVPFVFAQAGLVLATVMFVTLAAMMLVLHLMYGEVVERTKEKHMLIGYTEAYFGKRAKNLISVSTILVMYGGLIAYIALANQFFSTLFGELGLKSEFLSDIGWALVFWLVVSVIVIGGMKAIARLEVFLLALLVAVLLIVLGSSLPNIDFANYAGFSLSGAFAAYGVMLFSLGGFSAIPEIRSGLLLRGKKFKKAIASGAILAAVLTFLFGVVVLGVSGAHTTEDAITGLVPYLGSGVIYAGAVFGLLAVSTSYLVFASNLKDSFIYDWRLNKTLSVVLVSVVPIVLFVFGVRNIIQILGVTGSFMGAANGVVLVALFRKAKTKGMRDPGYDIKLPFWLVAGIAGAMAAGGIYAIISLIL